MLIRRAPTFEARLDSPPLAPPGRRRLLGRPCPLGILFSEQEGRYIAASVKRYRCSAPINMPILAVRTALTYFDETEIAQDRCYLKRLQHWGLCHDFQTRTFCVPMNSTSSSGSPSSSSISMTSR